MACGKVIIIPDNYQVYGMLERYSGILVSDLKIRAEGIRLAMELEGVDDPEVAQLLITYLSAAIRTRQKR